MNMFEAMKLLVSVVDHGNFSAAGRALGLAPSSVARRMAALEEELGVRLLTRTTRQLSLTEAGRQYQERARQILTDLEEAGQSVRAFEAEPNGTLKLNAAVSFGRLHIATALPDFLRLYPKVDIDLVLSDSFADLVAEGVDLAIRIGELSDSSLIARKLAPNRRLICASPDYFARKGTPRQAQDLREHDCLIYKFQAERSVWHLRCPSGEIHHIEVSGRMRSNSTDALYAAALGGQGMAILASWQTGADIDAGRLKVAFADHTVSPTALDTSIYGVFPYNRHLSPKVRAMVDFLVERFGPVPYWDRHTALNVSMTGGQGRRAD